ncbi:hypothetical protein [Nocardioides conyzicola]|uniref:hypothetical protein n=1 Tax=Nocardioides conyzicola TaxID=1651781 RepID=UPI0031EDBC85
MDPATFWERRTPDVAFADLAFCATFSTTTAQTATPTSDPRGARWEWELGSVAPTVVGLPAGATAVLSRTVTEVAPPLVTFESVMTIRGEDLRSVSTLRFRGRAEVERDLAGHRFEVDDVREAPDRPGKELVSSPDGARTEGSNHGARTGVHVADYGHRRDMADDPHDEYEHPHPTTNQPLNAEPRPVWTPLFAVVGLILLIAVVFAAITAVRYAT